MKKVLNYLSVIVLSLLMSQAGAEDDPKLVSNAVPSYLEFGGAKFFNEEIGWGTRADSFLPIWQRDLSQLLFLQAKGNTAFGKQLSGSLKLGYRSLYGGDIGLFGIYGGYDYLRSRSGHNYHQLAFGIENWFLRCFTRVNIYLPFGKNHHRIGPDAHKYDFDFNGKEIPDPHALERDIKKRINLFHEHEEEGLFCGADAAVGYELLPGLMITVGSCVETGKKPEFQTQLKYQFDLKNQRILNFFDRITCETGLRKSCGKTSGYLGISLGVNCAKGVTLSGVARHLNDLVATRELQLSRYTVRENLGKEKGELWIAKNREGRNVIVVSDVDGIEYLPNSAGTLARMGAYWFAVRSIGKRSNSTALVLYHGDRESSDWLYNDAQCPDCRDIYRDSEQDSVVGVLKKFVKPIRAGVAAWVFGYDKGAIQKFCGKDRWWCISLIKGEETYVIKNVPKLDIYGPLKAALTSVSGEGVKVLCEKLFGKGNPICKYAAALTKANLKEVVDKRSQLKLRDLWETTKKTITCVGFANRVANIQSDQLNGEVKYQVAFSMMDMAWDDMRRQSKAESGFWNEQNDYINQQREFYYKVEMAAYCIGAVAMVVGGFIPVVGPLLVGVGSWIVWGSQTAMMATAAAEVLELFN